MTDLAKIELLILDVDGVMTDGRILLTESGEEIKGFHVRDGSGIKYWMRVGKKVAIITGRGSPAVCRRAEELGIDLVRLNAKNKLPALEEILGELDLAPEQVAVIGDDLTDIPSMLHVGFAACVPEAPEEVQREVDYVTRTPGGRGAVREVIEYILKRTGQWNKVLDRYYKNKPPREAE